MRSCSKKKTVRRRTGAVSSDNPFIVTKTTPITSCRSFAGVGPSHLLTLNYVQVITIPASASAGTISSWSFRANSIYDPDLTGTGHQPLGRDLWATLYNHYLVRSAAITVEFAPLAASTVPVTCGILLHEDGTPTFTTIEGVSEQGSCTTKYTYPSAGFCPTVLRSKYSASKWFGVRNVDAALYTLGAAMGANPSDVAAWIVFVGATSAPSPAYECRVQIEYTCLLTEPTELATS